MQNAIVGLVDLTKDKVQPNDLPAFFWKHLQCDVDVLAKAVGRSMDDACLLLHLVLKQISTKNPPQCKYYLEDFILLHFSEADVLCLYTATRMKTNACLLAREARANWESDFNTAYIHPLVLVSSLM